MLMKNPSELPWNPAETKQLMSHAEVIALLRDKVERGKADDTEKKRFSGAVFALKKQMEEKEYPTSYLILAEAADGSEIRFDLREIRQTWETFYGTHSLPELANSLPGEIKLAPDQIQLLKDKAREGYTRAILIPPMSTFTSRALSRI